MAKDTNQRESATMEEGRVREREGEMSPSARELVRRKGNPREGKREVSKCNDNKILLLLNTRRVETRVGKWRRW